MPLKDKMKILGKLEEGVSNTDVGRFFSVSESTGCTIKKKREGHHGVSRPSPPGCSVHSP